MADTPIKTGEQHFGDVGITLRWAAFSHHLDFRAQHGDQQPDGSISYMYFPTGATANEPTDDFDVANTADRFVNGWVKWDGCSHVNFGDENGYLHLCGARDFRGLAFVLGEAMRIAAREVPSFDADCAEFAQSPALQPTVQQSVAPSSLAIDGKPRDPHAILSALTDVVYDGDSPSFLDIEAAAIAEPANMARVYARIVELLDCYNVGLLEADALEEDVARSSPPPSSSPVTPEDEIEIDTLLADFQRACETVVTRGDSFLSETTKERAIIRNLLRDKLLRETPPT